MTLTATSSWVRPPGCCLDGAIDGPSQLSDLDEVVEVAGLKAGILPVVDEGQEFACLLRAARSRGAVFSARMMLALITETAELRPSASRVASFAKSLPRVCS